MTTPPEDFTVFAEIAEADIFDTDEVCLFTWNPDPNRYPTTKPHEQYKILIDLLLINSSKVFSRFAFTPELTLNGNIHIHGWFVIKDKYKYFKWFLPKCKSFGFVKIDKMKSKNALEEYYKKDINHMNELMNEYDLPIPLTHDNIDAYKILPKSTKRLRLICKHKCRPKYKF